MVIADFQPSSDVVEERFVNSGETPTIPGRNPGKQGQKPECLALAGGRSGPLGIARIVREEENVRVPI